MSLQALREYIKNLEAERINNRKLAYKRFLVYYKKYQADRYKNDDKFRLDRNISRSIRRSLKNGSNRHNHWKSILGYTIKDLKVKLISTIPEGYTWKDYLSGELELDHIKPVGAFNYKKVTDKEFRKSWGLKNLRLIPKKINRIKSDSLTIYGKAECLPVLK